MTHLEIKDFLDSFEPFRNRTVVIIDFANVDKWERSLGWPVGIKELGYLIRYFSKGSRSLRRFYYGSDYGPNERSTSMEPWSQAILEAANWNGFEVLTKRVKYIHTQDNIYGYEKKCDLDVEMTVDLIREKDRYDNIVIFSGDGDLMCAVKYLKEELKKSCIVFGARGHIGREVFDAKNAEIVEGIYFAEDFEYRLSVNRRR